MKNRNTFRLTLLGLFTALIILMSFTPLGYFRTLGIEVTLLCIPVAAGAALLGKKGGAVLGGAFGLTSFIQCLTALSPFGAMILQLNWLGAFITCVIPRIIAGFAAGAIADAILRTDDKKHELLAAGAASLITPLCNTVGFMGSLVLFYWNTDYIQGFAGGKSIFPFVIAFVGINGLIEIITCLIIGTAIARALFAVNRRLK